MSLLFACTLLLQGTAGETFKKIEETLRKAKTVTVKFAQEQEIQFGKGKTAVRAKTSASGLLLIEGARRMDLTMKVASGLPRTKSFEVRAVSDDSTIMAKTNPSQTKMEHIDKTLRGSLPAAFLRAGVAVITPILSHPVGKPAPKGDLDLDKLFRASRFEWVDDDGIEKAIKYRLELPDNKSYDVTLAFNSKSLLPIKRTMVSSKREDGPATETYLELVLNADHPKDAFRVPSDK